MVGSPLRLTFTDNSFQVSCKVIALFLRDGQALKDCVELIAGAGGWVIPRNDYPTSFSKPTHRAVFHKLQRWPRAVGELAGDAISGPGQFLLWRENQTACFCLSVIGNRVPLNLWKTVSIRPSMGTACCRSIDHDILANYRKQGRKLRSEQRALKYMESF